MKTKPVFKYANPKYPTRLEIVACPDLLQRHQPPAWLQWPELTGVVGLFLLADASRLAAEERPPKDGQPPAQAAAATAGVAPIFKHGEGRGSTGCIVMAPPVFLSEEEALKVIREEMATKGVTLLTNQPPLAGVTGGRDVRKPAGVEAKPIEPFKADAADPKKKVVVEFLSEANVFQWDLVRYLETGEGELSTVQSYDLPKTATYLSDRVKRQATDKLYFGTFYDPIAGNLDYGKLRSKKPPLGKQELEKAQAEAVEAVKVESRKLLRLQVQDFLQWLQAQGVI